MKEGRKALLRLHLAVMLFGLSAVLGRYVAVPAAAVAGGRVLCSSLLLLAISLVRKDSLRLASRRDLIALVLTGAVLAVHWTAFFQSVQLASVAIGTITFSTFPLFLSFLEPLVFRERFRMGDLIGAGLLLLGVLIALPGDALGSGAAVGALWGMLSSLAYAVLCLSNRALAGRYESRTICLYEQGAAAILLFPALWTGGVAWRVQDVVGVALIGVLCTALAHTLYVSAQKHVRARTAGIVSGMESVYGILCAALFLGEIPTGRELLGGAVVLAVALSFSLRERGEK